MDASSEAKAYRTLAEEQAALRRVATLVARGATQKDVFASVVEEIAKLLNVDFAILGRYEAESSVLSLASWSNAGDVFPVGAHWPLGGTNAVTKVFVTRRPARIDNYDEASGAIGALGKAQRFRSSLGAPIFVEDQLWGCLAVGATERSGHLPPDTEMQLVSFTELVAMAIANTESRAELIASRARIAAAADETRRQIERDLHDGTQQQLVSLLLELREANARSIGVDDLRDQLARAASRLDDVLGELRELSRGIHPALLSKAGLNSAIKALGRRSGLPVEFDLRCDRRFPEQVEVAAYYVVSEALTNAVKHSQATVVTVEIDVFDTGLRMKIWDDGIGGANPQRGSGLVGLADRLEALGGRIDITSELHQGTSLLIEIPLVELGNVVAAGRYE